jgi:hypothetical protein
MESDRLRPGGPVKVYAILPVAAMALSDLQRLASKSLAMRHLAGRDQHDIEADVAPCIVGMLSEPEFGGGDDAAFAALGDRFRLVKALARLDL